jgi:hypothetical protein
VFYYSIYRTLSSLHNNIFFLISFSLFVGEVDFLFLTFHLNLRCFLTNLFKCLIWVFMLLMVVSIRLRRDFHRLHSQMNYTFICFEVHVICLDLVNLFKLVFSFLSKILA